MTFEEALQQIMDEDPETREIIESAINLAEEMDNEQLETMEIICYGICTPMCACWENGECKFHRKKAE